MHDEGEIRNKMPRPFLGSRADMVVVMGLGLLLILSVIVLRRITFDTTLTSNLPNNRALHALEQAEKIFPPEHLVAVALPCADPYSFTALQRLALVSSRIEEISAVSGHGLSLYSPTTVSTFERRGDELLTVPLVPSGFSPEIAKSHIDSSPLFRKLFLSTKADAWLMYIGVARIDSKIDKNLSLIRAEFPDLKFSGQPWVESRLHEGFSGEFILLLSLAALVLLLIQFILNRSWAFAFLLWAFSLIPTFVLLALMVLIGQPLRIAFVLAPVITLALSTSYITLLFRSWALSDCNPRAALKDRASIILIDSGSTIFGFASLLISPIADLVFLGWISIVGVLLSIVIIMLGLPAALGLMKKPPSLSRRVVAMAKKNAPSRLVNRVRIVIGAAIAFCLGFLAMHIGVGYKSTDIFPPWSAPGKDMLWFAKHAEGLGEAELVIETGKENGIVDLGFWKDLRDLEAGIRTFSGVGTVYSVPELVGEVLARYEGRPGIKEARTEAEIGESLELLSGASKGLFSSGAVTRDWSGCLVHIAIAPSFDIIRDMPVLQSKVEALAAKLMPGVKLAWGGDPVRNSIVESAFISGQIEGTFIFFGMLVLGLAVIFRSFWKALAISIAPVMGFLAALGTIGLLGWRLSTENAIALAVIAGTGEDSAIFMVSRGWSGQARGAAIDTTILIVSAMLVLVLSSFFLVVQTAIICAVGIIASTLTTIFVLPAFGALNPAREAKK